MPTEGYAKCMHCDTQLSLTPIQPCPSCGKSGTSAVVNATGAIGARASVTGISEYEKRNVRNLSVTIAITIAGAVIAAYLDRYAGIAVSIGFGILSIWIGKRAWAIIKEIEQRG